MKKFFLILFAFCNFLLPNNLFSQQQKGPVVLIVGTRPEAIKMIPLYLALQEEKIPTLLCSTGQHADLLKSIFTLFGVEPDIDFKIMKPAQNLSYITEIVLQKTQEFFKIVQPSLVVVQGDTTSAMSASLSAFYLKIPVAHVEAGLRSGNLQAPFPEEANRRIISLLASYHFAPTSLAATNLLFCGTKQESIFCTGNTVVDALHLVRDKIVTKQLEPSAQIASIIETQKTLGRKIFLLTAHRRESFSGGLQEIFLAVKQALQEDPNLFVIYPTHPNPVIQNILQEVELDTMPNMRVIPPVPYEDLVYVLDAVDAIATDSGGIQEEAVSLNKPVLVLRNETDRPEGIQNGTALLVGTKREEILKRIRQITNATSQIPTSTNSVYGDGHASQKIAHIIKEIIEK